MDLQKRVIFGLLLMAGAALAVGAICLFTLRGTFDNQSKVYNTGHVIFHLKKVADAYADVISAVKKVQSGDTWAWEEGSKKIDGAEKAEEENWTAYLAMDKTKDEKYWASILGSQIDTSKHMMEDLHNDFVSKDLRDLTIQASGLDPTIEPIQDNIRKLEEINEKISQEAIVQAEKGFNESFDLLMIVAVVVLLAGLISGFALGTWGLRSLSALLGSFSVGIEQAASQSEQVAILTGQLSANLFESTNQLQKAEKASEKIVFTTQQNKQEANLARHFVEEAQSAISAGGESAQKTAVFMKNMGQGADRVFQIVKTIEEIAFQTNILALNAGVEAVRAGDQGKEFVLVVEEIRNLSQRCTQVARETSKLVTDNVAQTNEGVRFSEETKKSLTQAFELSGKAASLMNVIESGIELQTTSLREVQVSANTAQQEAYRNSASGEKLKSLGAGMSQQVEVLRQVSDQLKGLLLSGGSQRPLARASKEPSAKGTPAPTTSVLTTPTEAAEKRNGPVETKMAEKTGTDGAKIVHMNK